MPRYSIFFNDSHLNKIDGVVLHIKNTLNYTIVKKDCIGLKLVSTKINVKSTKFKITGLYRCHELKKG